MSMFENEYSNDFMSGFGVNRALSVKYADPMRDCKMSSGEVAKLQETSKAFFGGSLFIRLFRR